MASSSELLTPSHGAADERYQLEQSDQSDQLEFGAAAVGQHLSGPSDGTGMGDHHHHDLYSSASGGMPSTTAQLDAYELYAATTAAAAAAAATATAAASDHNHHAATGFLLLPDHHKTHLDYLHQAPPPPPSIFPGMRLHEQELQQHYEMQEQAANERNVVAAVSAAAARAGGDDAEENDDKKKKRGPRQTSICHHGKRRSQCVQCYDEGTGGSTICKHRRQRYACFDEGQPTNSLCQHRTIRIKCRECTPDRAPPRAYRPRLKTAVKSSKLANAAAAAATGQLPGFPADPSAFVMSSAGMLMYPQLKKGWTLRMHKSQKFVDSDGEDAEEAKMLFSCQECGSQDQLVDGPHGEVSCLECHMKSGSTQGSSKGTTRRLSRRQKGTSEVAEITPPDTPKRRGKRRQASDDGEAIDADDAGRGRKSKRAKATIDDADAWDCGVCGSTISGPQTYNKDFVLSCSGCLRRQSGRKGPKTRQRATSVGTATTESESEEVAAAIRAASSSAPPGDNLGFQAALANAAAAFPFNIPGMTAPPPYYMVWYPPTTVGGAPTPALVPATVSADGTPQPPVLPNGTAPCAFFPYYGAPMFPGQAQPVDANGGVGSAEKDASGSEAAAAHGSGGESENSAIPAAAAALLSLQQDPVPPAGGGVAQANAAAIATVAAAAAAAMAGVEGGDGNEGVQAFLKGLYGAAALTVEEASKGQKGSLNTEE
ncbi:hypothetical protein HK101_004932 [Irineochytrium annulatum]|nr:hypothetical protein HK101_004932 [Irineochytrium annulatum]